MTLPGGKAGGVWQEELYSLFLINRVGEIKELIQRYDEQACRYVDRNRW